MRSAPSRLRATHLSGGAHLTEIHSLRRPAVLLHDRDRLVIARDSTDNDQPRFRRSERRLDVRDAAKRYGLTAQVVRKVEYECVASGAIRAHASATLQVIATATVA